jgi:TetR/AcrR family transcriptional regulator, regulator of mycofactocin system
VAVTADVVRARGDEPVSAATVGRPLSTSRQAVEQAAFALFEANGFDETSVDDIAGAAGIGRRTFFRYFPSKNDLVWGDFEQELQKMRDWLDDSDPPLPLMTAIRQAVIRFNRIEPGNEAAHRRRMKMILGVPTLFANSTLRFASWRSVVVDFAARRLDVAPDDLVPAVIGYSSLGAAIAAYEQWLSSDDADLAALLDAAFSSLAAGFAESRQPTNAR